MMLIPETVRGALAAAVIVAALVGIAVGRLPRLRMNRASLAFAGAAFLIALGALEPEAAFAAIDLRTLILILSMMVITMNLKLAGFFELAGVAVIRAAGTPRRLLALIMAAAGLLSALFLNDTICIMMTPLAAALCLRAKRDPAPYLIGLALSANIGSAATIIGNPQNMLIGAQSGIRFLRFFSRLAIPSVLGVVVAYVVVLLCFRKEFSGSDRLGAHGAVGSEAYLTLDGSAVASGGRARQPSYKPLLYKCLAAIVIMVAAFLMEIDVVVGPMMAAALLLTTRRIKAERVFAELDWSIITFFGGLFIITAAVARSPAFVFLVDRGLPAVGQSMVRFSVFTVALSNLVSNVPAVMLLRPLVTWFADNEKAWLVMAMASTYAGNLTLLGSVANLIVAESAKRYGIHIGFGAYLKAGLPTTLITVAIGTAWLVLT